MSLTEELTPIVPAFSQVRPLTNDLRLADYYAKRPSELRSFETRVVLSDDGRDYANETPHELCTLNNYRGY